MICQRWGHDFQLTSSYFPTFYFIINLEADASPVLYLLHMISMHLAMQLEQSRKESHPLLGASIERNVEREFSFSRSSKESTNVKHGL